MNRFLSVFFVLAFGLTLMLCNCKNIGKEEKVKVEDKNNIELFNFIFQPSLNENTELIINFNKKYLSFKSIYPISPEPEPYIDINGEINNLPIQKPLKPFLIILNKDELNKLESILNNLKEDDFHAIESLNIDGISYNFSITKSNNDFKVGYIKAENSKLQRELVSEISRLLSTNNPFKENEKIISYYLKFQ